MDPTTETKHAFLPISSEDGSETDYNDWRYEKASLRKRYVRRFIIAQVVLLLIYTAVMGLLLRNPSVIYKESPKEKEVVYVEKDGQEDKTRTNEFVYTPAASVSSFKPTLLNMHLYKDNPYKGPPNDDLDNAWNNLFANAYIRLSEDELLQLGRNSTPIPDGSGQFMGALDMYHQLHCVRFIYQYVHQDYYTLRKINVPAQDHINHCIDVIRQVIMCYADTSISTMSFHSDYTQAWPEFKFEHSCRNWDAIDSWAAAPGRGMGQSDPAVVKSWLQNPNYDTSTTKEFDGHGEDDSD